MHSFKCLISTARRQNIVSCTSDENGAAPAYVEQWTGFEEVTCEANNKNCQVPANNNQGLQSNVDSPCLEETAPDGMDCREVAKSWAPECQDNATAAQFLADGFKCGCMSDKVQQEGYCERSCGKCSPVFVSKLVSVCVLRI